MEMSSAEMHSTMDTGMSIIEAYIWIEVLTVRHFKGTKLIWKTQNRDEETKSEALF